MSSCPIGNTVQRYNNSLNYGTDRMKKFQKRRFWTTRRRWMGRFWTKRAFRIGYDGVAEHKDEASIWISWNAGRVKGAAYSCGRNKKGRAGIDVGCRRHAAG